MVKRLNILIILLIILILNIQIFAQDTVVIGFAQVGTESGWRVSFSEATLAEAEARGINLLFVDGENSQDKQFEALRMFIEEDVDAIILAPVVETGWDSILQDAQDAEIPVIIVDRNVTSDPSLYLTRVASDFEHEGRLAAAWLVQATSGDCSIIEIEGTIGSSAARDRQLGFNEVISMFPNMNIILSQSGEFTRDGGYGVMEGVLLTEDISKICAVWSHNDDMALGAIEAMKNAGSDPADDILIVSVDAVPAIFDAMINGDTNATIELSPYMAAPAFDVIDQYLAGEEIPKSVPVYGDIYLPDTAEEEFQRRTNS